MQWRDLAATQSGVVRADQLLAAGMSTSAVGRLAANGILIREERGVYRVGGAPSTFRSRLWVGVLATDGVLSHHTAGRLWGVLDDADPLVHVRVPGARRISPPCAVRVHRGPVGAVRELSGLPVIARPDTVLDLLAVLPPEDADRLADRALQQGWLTHRGLQHAVADRTGRTGTAQLRRLAAQTGGGAAALSERILHRLLRRAGIAGWVANFPIWMNGEHIGTVDVAFPRRRLAIEIDGWAFHHARDRFQRDRTKQNVLVAHGWTVLRFTWADLTQRPGYVLAMLRQQAA